MMGQAGSEHPAGTINRQKKTPHILFSMILDPALNQKVHLFRFVKGGVGNF